MWSAPTLHTWRESDLRRTQNISKMKTMNDNLYFISTPIEIQDEVYFQVLEKLEKLNIPSESYVYLKFSSITNLPDKFFFNGYVRNVAIEDKSTLCEPDFLIFLS